MSDIKSVEDIISILSRDSIDGDAVNKTLLDATVTNFNTLLDIQNDLIGYKRFDIPFSELEVLHRTSTRDNRQHFPHRHGYRIQESFVAKSDRQACARLGFYNKILTQEEISKNKSVFKYNFIVFIEGYFIDTAELIINDNETIFVLDVSAGDETYQTDGIPLNDYYDYRDRNVSVTFMIVPNYTFDKLEINKPTLYDVLHKKIPYIRFGSMGNIDNDNSLIFLNSDTHRSTKTGTFCNIDNESKFLTIPNDIDFVNSNEEISIITLNDVYDIIDINPGDSTVFTLSERYELPLPPTNIIPFRISGKQFMFDNSIEIKLYYPNFYKITNWDNTSTLRLYILYRETTDSKYYNELTTLSLLGSELINRYEEGNLPDFVLDYEPSDSKWIQDANSFINSVYYPNKTFYNTSVLSNLVLKNAHFFIEYLYLKLKSSPKFFINVNKLDLNERLRNDTMIECQDAGTIIIFDEPHYIFSLRKSFVGSFGYDFRIYIDNKLIEPKYITIIPAMDHYHFYIPTRVINDNSIIEIEKFIEFDKSLSIQFSSIDEIKVIPIHKEISKIYTRDILLINKATGAFISSDKYKIIAYNKLADSEIELVNDQYSIIENQFKIIPLSEDIINMDIEVRLHHRMLTETVSLNEESINNLVIEDVYPNSNNIVNGNVRFFVGGLLMPSEMYETSVLPYSTFNVDFDLFIDVESDHDKYKFITIDNIPVPYKCVFSMKHIDNEYGFVDTGESLPLPLDLKWYDIYVNGLRLNKSNIDIVTSSKFFIKNIESRSNLYIFAREDIFDEFDILHNETIENRLFDNIDDIYQNLIKDRDIVRDILEDITTDLLVNVSRHVKFVREILEFTFINANEQQVTPEIRELFPEFIDENGIFWLNTNEYPDALRVTFINSNVRYEFMKNDQYRYGWSPLFIGSHDDAKTGEYLCDPITGAPGMKNADGTVIPIGELDRLTIHKNNFQDVLTNSTLSHLDVYQLQFDENTMSRDITLSENILDDTVDIDSSVTTAVISLDIQVLKRGYKNVMTYSSYVPTVNIEYIVDERTIVTSIPYNELATTSLTINSNTGFTINKIYLSSSIYDEENIDTVKCVLHSILIAF